MPKLKCMLKVNSYRFNEVLVLRYRLIKLVGMEDKQAYFGQGNVSNEQWTNRWSGGCIGFHKSEVNRFLKFKKR